MRTANMSKLLLLALILCIPFVCGGCSSKPEAPAPNAGPPALMVDGTLYYSTGNSVTIEVDESEYLGRITSVVNISKMPSENGQANIPFDGAPYVEYQEGIALLMDNEWVLFEARADE